MITKYVLIFMILSIVGCYEGIHRSKLISGYLSFNEKDIDKFNLKCHYAMYNYIYHSLYVPTEIHKCSDAFLKSRIQNIVHYHSRLFRVYYNGANSHVKTLGYEMWNFIILLNAWNNRVNDQKVKNQLYATAKALIEFIKSKQELSELTKDINDSQKFISSFEVCEKTLNSISKPSMSMEYSLFNTFLEMLNDTNINETIETILPIKYEYGHIILLIREKELSLLDSIQNSNDQKIFVINIMKESLINIIDVMTNIIYRIPHFYKKFNTENFKIFLNEYKTGYIIAILRHMYNKFIETTQALFSMLVDDKTTDPLEFINNYLYFTDKFKTKWIHIYPPLLPEYKITNNNEEIYGENNRNINNYTRRLTTYNEVTNTHSIRVSMFGYYNVIEMDENDEPGIKTFLETYDAKILMELNLWLTVINNYTNLMNADTSLIRKKITSYETEFQRRCAYDKDVIK